MTLSTKSKLYDTQLVPSGKMTVLQMWYGPNIGWSTVKLFNNEQEAKEWLKGGIASSKSKR